MAPAATAHYLWAALARPDVAAALPAVRCRLLLVYGEEALYRGDCQELACRVRKDRLAVLEVMQVGQACRPTRAHVWLSNVCGWLRLLVACCGATC